MGGVSLSKVRAFDGYSCPFCPTTVVVTGAQGPRDLMLVATSEEARRAMESHLDGHFGIGLPVGGAA